MTFKTLMVHMKLGHTNSDLLGVAADLAKWCDVRVIGIAACQPTPLVTSDGYLLGTFVEEDLKEIDRELKVAETEFCAAFSGSSTATDWRSATVYEAVADYVARQCRAADLIITSSLCHAPNDTARPESPGDLLMQAGRPVLIVPRTQSTLDIGHIVIAWKNTREARRAIADALPLLALARKVTVLELASAHERARVMAQLTDVCGWLKTHGIAAEPDFLASTTGEDSAQLNAAFEASGAGVVIAGAYGHSRFREWALGGVTRDLALQATYCTMLSH